MKDIPYFSTMIQIRHHVLRTWLAAVAVLFGIVCGHAANGLTAEQEQHIDSAVYVGLVTCQPSSEAVYSLYGHTAIHFVNTEMGIDVAANWGVFSLNQENFVFRFLMGTALYALDIQPYDQFCQYYAMHRRGIVEQPLNLTAIEKLRFAEALEENFLPQNRDYRYDFFYDNCSTRAREIIIRCVGGGVSYAADDAADRPSFRLLTHQYNADHPWARFGNDILLGLKADQPISQADAQFLPERLMADFAKAAKGGGAGDVRQPLVGETKVVVPYFPQAAAEEFPLRPRACFLLLLGIIVVLTLCEWHFNRHYWPLDALLMVTAGLGGVILFGMIFSHHPTVSLNLQLLLLNPLPLFFVWRMVSRSRRRRRDGQYLLWIVLICLFFVGNLWQTYAEGMNLVAAALLVRNVALWLRQRPLRGKSRRVLPHRARLLACALPFAIPASAADTPDVSQLVVNEIQAANIDMFLNPAYNFSGWMELYNPTDRDINLGQLYFSDDMQNLKLWKSGQPMGTVGAKSYYVVWFEDNECSDILPSFKLDANGGEVFVSDDDGRMLLHFSYPKAIARTSWARTTDGGSEWAVCTSPTPGMPNAGGMFTDGTQAEPPRADCRSCVFTDPFTVHVTIPEGCTLRYTTDGSVPTLDNGHTSSDGAFSIAETTLLRLRSFREGCVPSAPISYSFLWSEMPIGNEDAGMTVGDLTLPILSVVGDDRFFYDDQVGVFVKGTNGLAGNGMDEPCNRNRSWPRAVSFAYLADGHTEAFSKEVWLEVSGAWSRAHEPHPFKLKANKVFGQGKTLDYPFFSEKPFIRNRTLQMRNGVDTYDGRPAERFKDAFISYIIQHAGIDLEMQSYQPVAHFVNGQYKGVIDMREPNNKHYVFANHGWDDEEIDMFEAEEPDTLIFSQGDRDAFDQLYALSYDAADEQSYSRIRQLLDIDEYINYMALELYIGNNDWIKNNMKWFRHRDGGPFRIVLFDLDAAFNKYGMVTDWLTTLFDGWQMTTLFFNLMENDGFRRQFIDTYCLMGGSIFWPELTRELTNQAKDRIENDLQAQGESAAFMVGYIDKWLVPYSNSYNKFIQQFGQARLADTESYRLHLYGEGAGTVLMNGLAVPHAQYHGWFFPPVTLEAIAPAGMRFAGWEDAQTGTIVCTEPAYDVPAEYTTLVPRFAALDDTQRTAIGLCDVVVNEVSAANNSYVNDHFKRSDWIELHNTTDHDIDIAGMYLSNDSTDTSLYRIGETGPGTDAPVVIPARGHLVVWCDQAESRGQLHAPFKLSKAGGCVCLTSADGTQTDIFRYPAHDERHTVGRYPDGAADIYVMNVPTIGKPNMRTSYLQKVSAPHHDGIESIGQDGGLTIRYTRGMLMVEDASRQVRSVVLSLCNQSGTLLRRVTLNLHEGMAVMPVGGLGHGCFIATAAEAAPGSRACRFCQ